VAGATACPGSRRGLPGGVTVFANATINKTTSYPCIAPRVQKHAPPRLCANATYRRTLCGIKNEKKMKQILVLLTISLCNLTYGQTMKALWNENEIGDISVLLFRQQNNNLSSTGTATIIYHENRYFLLTAAHVAKDMDSLSKIVFHVENDKPMIVDLKSLTLLEPIAWTEHNEADIAILELKLPTDTLLKNRFESIAFPIAQIYNGKDLPSRSAGITFVGFPVIDLDLIHFSALFFNANICSGLITQNRGDNKKKCTFFYLNTPSVQGCSGSGVFFSVQKDMYFGGDQTILIGVMHGTYSDNTGGKLAAITPSYYIFDLFK